MTGEGLFNLVQSLSKQQKANFSRFVDARKGSKPNYYTLFERMLSRKTYDEKQIRGRLFQNPGKYYQNREILIDKLIQSLVYFNGSRGSVRSYVLQAIELNVPDLARKRLKASMVEAHECNDWASLEFLHRLRDELGEAYRVALPLPGSVPSAQEVRKVHRSWELLEDLQNRIKHHLQHNFGDHLFHAEAFQSKLDETPVIGDKGLYLSKKVRVSLEILRQRYDKAVHFQEKVVEVLNASGIFLKNALLIKEYSILTRLALEVGADQTALQSAFRLGAVPATNSREEELRAYYKTKSLVAVAKVQGNFEMGLEGYTLLKDHTGLFTEGEVPTYLLGCAIVFFLHGEYQMTLESLATIRAAKRSHWEELNWSVDLLRLLCNYELENIEVLDSLYRTLVRTAQSQEREFPLFASRLVSKMFNTAGKEEASQVWQEGREMFTAYCSDPKENLMANVFDLRLWFESKANGISIIQMFHNQRQEVKRERFRDRQSQI